MIHFYGETLEVADKIIRASFNMKNSREVTEMRLIAGLMSF